MATTHDQFPQDAMGLPEARASEAIGLGHGDRFDLRIALAAKRLGEGTMRILACNGSIPGPRVRVRAGSKIVVDIENGSDVDATVHWDRLRLECRYDGTHKTQRPMARREACTAYVTFPDPGTYWYHPRIGKVYGQGRCARAPHPDREAVAR